MEQLIEANDLFFDGKIIQAICSYQKIVKQILQDGDKSLLQEYGVQGLANIDDQKGHYHNNIALWYAQQIRSGKSKPNPFQALALCFSFRTRVYEGRVWYEQQLQKYPNVYQLTFGLATCYYNADRIDQAFKMYAKTVSLNQKCGKGYQGLANLCLYKLEQNQRARQYAQQALMIESTNTGALIIMACTQHHPTNILKLEQLIEKQPQMKCKLYHLLGVVNYEHGNVDQAAQYFMKSLDSQELISAIICLSNIAIQRGFFSQALSLAQWSMKIEQSNFDGVIALGVAFLYLQMYQQAGQWLYSASEIKENHYLPSYYLGVLNYQKDELDEALQWFQLAQKQNKHCKKIQLYIASIEELIGNSSKATRVLQGYIKDNSDMPEIQFQLGKLCFQRKKYQEALKHFMRAFQIANHHLSAFMVGCCYLNINYEQEIYNWNLVLKRVGRRWDLYKWAGKIFHSPLFYFQKALLLNPYNQDVSDVAKEIKEIKGSR